MTLELAIAIIVFLLTAFSFLFSLTRASGVEGESFPNRGRFFAGLIVWLVAAILAVFISFPGYGDWFLPVVYPILKVALLGLFLAGFFMIITTVVAFPVHLDYFRKEVSGRSDRIAILENIRQIASQPYPITETFSLVLRELASFLVVKKAASFLINPSRREMYLVAQVGLDREELRRLERFPFGQDIISRSAQEQSPYVSGDVASSDPATRKLILAGRQLNISVAAVPLYVRDRSLGALMVISDKPFAFEKRDRLLLNAAGEALAGVVENNRLLRENQKLQNQMDFKQEQVRGFRLLLQSLASEKVSSAAIKEACRYLVERYNLSAARMMRLSAGNLEEVTSYEATPDAVSQSESYRIAIIDAIRKARMVILNQEAVTERGDKYIARSTLLCPLTTRQSAGQALLLEAPGDGLRITDEFIGEVESLVNFAMVALSLAVMQEIDRYNQSVVRALLNILKIKSDAPDALVFRQFLEELGRAYGGQASLLLFVPDQKNGYRLLDSHGISIDPVAETAFLPGEGPVGQAGATGMVVELIGRERVDRAWDSLEPINQDFPGRLFRERSAPEIQIYVPIKILDDISGVVAIYPESKNTDFGDKEKGLVLLAIQLLSIKLTMARLDEAALSYQPQKGLTQSGHILNRVNNDLATVLGRAQLLARQPDLNGRTHYTTEEIIKAAESAAAAIRRLQEGINLPEEEKPGKSAGILQSLKAFLDAKHVTGNLYMFDDSRPVMLQVEFDKVDDILPPDESLYNVLESMLVKFLAIMDEREELFLQAKDSEGEVFITFLRGSREKYAGFNARHIDFGDPDVMPEELLSDDLLQILAHNNGAVSFDRFGRRPTYVSFRFPTGAVKSIRRDQSEEEYFGGLKILAIDDQQMILDLLSGICSSLGLQLETAQQASHGIELFKRGHFDLVMVDLIMDEMSGWDVAREIKTLSPNIPVILMTGWGINISPEEAAGRGIDFTLAKPFKIEQLTEIINLARRRKSPQG